MESIAYPRGCGRFRFCQYELFGAEADEFAPKTGQSRLGDSAGRPVSGSEQTPLKYLQGTTRMSSGLRLLRTC